MEVALVGLSGPAAGTRADVPLGVKMLVGRGGKSHHAIAADAKLADEHFEIGYAAGRCAVRDLGKDGGTHVNGRKLGTAPLDVRHGDVILAGTSHFRVRIQVPEIWTDLTPAEKALLALLYGAHERVWAILDAAREDRIPAFLEACDAEHVSLFEGPRARDLKSVAPFLAMIPNGSKILRILLREGWGKSWGVYFTSPAAMPDLRRHLQQFLTMQDAAGRRYIYRFYDPRVLRSSLPTTLGYERVRFFGPIARFVFEGPDGAPLVMGKAG
jgi:hypothetical protein